MDNNLLILFLVILSPLLLISLVLLMGRGGAWFDIVFSRFGNSSRDKYNERKLCTTFGVYALVLFVASTLLLALRNSGTASIVYVLFITVWSFASVFYANKFCTANR